MENGISEIEGLFLPVDVLSDFDLDDSKRLKCLDWIKEMKKLDDIDTIITEWKLVEEYLGLLHPDSQVSP